MAEKRKKYQIDGDKLKEARKWASLSVEQLSEKAKCLANIAQEERGFSVSEIQKYEKGGAYIYADKLKILATILKIKPEHIIFYDTPEPLSETSQFRAWFGFVESASCYKNKYSALTLYNGYAEFVFSCCAPSWDALSKLNSTEKSQKENSNATHDAIYTYTRKLSLKKVDFHFTRDILQAINRSRNEAMLKVTVDRHIAEKFRRLIEKHQQLLDKIQEQVEIGAIQYNLTDLEQLKEYFSMLFHFLIYAEQRTARIVDEYSNGDWAAFQEELYDQIMYAELEEL